MSFGVIFHIGIYSVYAFDSINSAKKRKMCNGSEWYKKRISENEKSYRPVSGWRETKAFHEKNYDNCEYFDVVEQFNVELEEISKWMSLSKK